jgi:arylsulfatase A-like enzyme
VVSHGGAAKLADKTPVLPQLFLKAGYTTCALDNLMRERMWFGRGYEYYIDPGQRRILGLGVSAEELNHRAIPWLQAHRDEPFFFFIHYWDPHVPYMPPEKYQHLFYQGDACDPDNHSLDGFWPSPLGRFARDTWLGNEKGIITDAEYITALYDQEIRHVDDGIGQLVGTLDDLGIADRTLVVIVGDHGESMTEHGIFFEHHGLYEPTLHIPLVMRWPARLPAGTRLPHLLQNHDLAPTLLEAAGLSVPRSMNGRSFWKLATGEEQSGGREEIISEECTLQAKWCLRTDRYKLILAREPDLYGNPMRELYDLHVDPNETRNVAAELPEVAAELEGRLENWIASQLTRSGRRQDPLIEQGISLKSCAEEWIASGQTTRQPPLAASAGIENGQSRNSR